MEINEFAARLFETRDTLHIMHLKTKSYAAHKTLGELYQFLSEWLDNFLETFRGFSDTSINDEFEIDTIHVEDQWKTDPVTFIRLFIGTTLMSAKAEMAGDMSEYGFLVNMIEELIAECYHSIYKLNFLVR